jgi:hypothetical protein
MTQQRLMQTIPDAVTLQPPQASAAGHAAIKAGLLRRVAGGTCHENKTTPLNAVLLYNVGHLTYRRTCSQGRDSCGIVAKMIVSS